MHQPPTGVTDRAVLRRLLRGEFTGSAPQLAQETRCQERYIWLAVAGMAARGLIAAERNALGILRLKINKAGRQVHAGNERKYAPTAKERKQGRVSFS
jgi:hypothetical protein